MSTKIISLEIETTQSQEISVTIKARKVDLWMRILIVDLYSQSPPKHKKNYLDASASC